MNFSTSSHLGDCLWTCQMLRRLGGGHSFYCRADFVDQLRELMGDTCILVQDIAHRPDDAIDTWIANAQFEKDGIFFRSQGDIIGFIVDYMNHVGGLAGTPAPLFERREQFLFDLPCSPASAPQFDVLVVNAKPTSGQVPAFDNAQMNGLIEELAQHRSVICTNPTSAKNVLHFDGSIMRIAELSKRCALIVGVATGPLWLTFNTQNRHVRRHILLSPMHLDYGPSVPIRCHPDVESVRQGLREEGWL